MNQNIKFIVCATFFVFPAVMHGMDASTHAELTIRSQIETEQKLLMVIDKEFALAKEVEKIQLKKDKKDVSEKLIQLQLGVAQLQLRKQKEAVQERVAFAKGACSPTDGCRLESVKIENLAGRSVEMEVEIEV